MDISILDKAKFSTENQELLSPEFKALASKADPMTFWGLWDGYETIEKI